MKLRDEYKVKADFIEAQPEAIPPPVFVNSVIAGSGHPRRMKIAPLQYDLTYLKSHDIWVRTYIGPPKHGVPWYDAPPPNGNRICQGLGTGAVYGPRVKVHHTTEIPEELWLRVTFPIRHWVL